uniref:CCHC-type domain-containing protein n=1 Tax=Brassica oleracea var. oleracea TaxID=109376 RepID=A0A0D3CUL2_BRAOL
MGLILCRNKETKGRDKTGKAVKTTSKAQSTRCFKCHRIGYYANKCQNQKPLVTLESDNVETEPDKEGFSDLLPIFDDYALEPMADLRKNLFEEGGNDVPQPMDQYMEPAQYGDQDVLKNSTEVCPPDRTRQTDRAVYRINPRTSGKELWLEPRPDDRTYRTRARLFRPSRHSKDNSRARLKLGHEEPKDGHAFSSGGPSGQSRVRPSPYRIGHSQFG